jgi:hypothetical protein
LSENVKCLDEIHVAEGLYLDILRGGKNSLLVRILRYGKGSSWYNIYKQTVTARIQVAESNKAFW